MTTLSRESGWNTIAADEIRRTRPARLRFARETRLKTANCPEFLKIEEVLAGARSLPIYETQSGFMYIGELTNEDKNLPQHQGSFNYDVKSDNAKEDGIVAGLLATAAVAPGGASLEMAQEFFA